MSVVYRCKEQFTMLNFELQLSILKSISATYADEKRVEINSKQFDVDQDTFVYNMAYLKKEKLLDLSSMSSRTAANAVVSSDEPETVAAPASTSYTIARCIITHAGLKALCANNGTRIISAN